MNYMYPIITFSNFTPVGAFHFFNKENIEHTGNITSEPDLIGERYSETCVLA